MTQTLELMLDSTRRQVQSDAEDVRAWEKAQGIDLVAAGIAVSAVVTRQCPVQSGRRIQVAAGIAVSAVVTRVIAIYEGMEATDRLFQQFAGNSRPNAEAAKRAEMMVGGFEAYADLADALLRSIEKLPPDHRPRIEQTAELKRLRDAANEMSSIYRGEAQYFSGSQFARWEDVRAKLGV
jgi:hypothetical protein